MLIEESCLNTCGKQRKKLRSMQQLHKRERRSNSTVFFSGTTTDRKNESNLDLPLFVHSRERRDELARWLERVRRTSGLEVSRRVASNFPRSKSEREEPIQTNDESSQLRPVGLRLSNDLDCWLLSRSSKPQGGSKSFELVDIFCRHPEYELRRTSWRLVVGEPSDIGCRLSTCASLCSTQQDARPQVHWRHVEQNPRTMDEEKLSHRKQRTSVALSLVERVRERKRQKIDSHRLECFQRTEILRQIRDEQNSDRLTALWFRNQRIKQKSRFDLRFSARHIERMKFEKADRRNPWANESLWDRSARMFERTKAADRSTHNEFGPKERNISFVFVAEVPNRIRKFDLTNARKKIFRFDRREKRADRRKRSL